MRKGQSSLSDKVLKGDIRSAARLISLIENQSPEALDELEALYPHTGRAHIVGITGAPGTGKSTLTDCLVEHFRRQEKTVGVIAVDPTSSLTGGAVLGDRIRMQRHAADPLVFIRSLATRGWAGGLARAVIGAVHVLDAMGQDIVFVETVGSGQVEVDIVRAADTTVLVMNPDAGDEVQAMKAGILETADIFAVNKADREGAGRLRAELEGMLAMKTCKAGEWSPQIILTEAIADKGIDFLVEAIAAHRQNLAVHNKLSLKRRQRVRLELLGNVEAEFKETIDRLDGSGLDRLVDGLIGGRISRTQAVVEIKRRIIVELTGKQE
jgi:LAO/AO transport system kinase